MATYYTAPNGTAGGSGTIGSPWDLQTALDNASQTVGDILYLRGGTYNFQYISNLDGGTVRSYPGEWAVIDGYYTNTTSSSVDADDTALSLNGSKQLASGQVIRIFSSPTAYEDIRVQSGTAPNYTVIRGWNGTTATSHSSGASFYLFGNTLTVNGQDTIYRDFEVTDSNPTREYDISGYGGDLRGGEGIFNFGASCKFINLVLHDNADGIFESETATATEINGCLCFNNGSVSIDRPNGLGLYVQNAGPSIKTIKDCIILNSFASGMKVYGAASGNADYVTIDGVVSFNNGCLGYYTGTPTTHGGGALNRRFNNMEVGSDVNPSTDIIVTNSMLYHPPGNVTELPGLVIGRAPTGGNTDATITDNIVVEPYGDLLSIDRWAGLTVTGNTLVFNQDDQQTFFVKAVNPITSVGTFNSNFYYGNMHIFTGTCQGDIRAPFFFSGTQSACGSDWLTFTEWKTASGWDAASTFTTSVPTTNIVNVVENDYEPGRNHIVVYNFEGSLSFDFTPQGLAVGQAYKIIDVQNWPTVYQSGVYSGGDITVSLDGGAAVRTATGHVFTPDTMQPDFGVFILIAEDSIASFSNVQCRNVILD